MKTTKRPYARWERRIRKRLRYATFDDGYLRHFMQIFPESQTIVVFSKKHVMGWAFALPRGNTVHLSLFVNRRYRKMGVGTLLVKEALKNFDVVLLAAWNNTTRRLFEKLKKQYPSKIRVFDWWKAEPAYTRLILAAR